MAEVETWIRGTQEPGYTPAIEEVPPVGEEEVKKYMATLHQCFVRGERTQGSLDKSAVPVLLAPLMKGESELTFPLVYDTETQQVNELLEVLKDEFNNTFQEGEAEELKNRLAEIAVYARDNFDSEFNSVIENALGELVEIFPFEDENMVFEENCKRFRDQIKKDGRLLIERSDSAMFQLLNKQLAERSKRHGTFLAKLKTRISGLRDLVLLHSPDEPDTEQANHYRFAGDLLSIGEVDKVAATSASNEISEERLNRIHACLQTLEEALATYEEYGSVTFSTHELNEEFKLSEQLFTTKFELCGKDTIAKARTYSNHELENFVKMMSAFKIAELELDQKYDEKLHTPYFEKFDFEHLSDTDLGYIRPVLIIEETESIVRDTGGFIAMISGGTPVKILAINRIGGSSVSHSAMPNNHELAAMAIFRRNTYVFQGAIDTPQLLNDAFSKGMQTHLPALWNVIVTSKEYDEQIGSVLLNAAVESRYFPRVEFDIGTGVRFGSHLHVELNKDSEKDFPLYAMEIGAEEKSEERQYYLTVADLLAALPENQEQLECVPAGYDSQDLMPLSEYIIQSPGLMTGKMPFIWVVDEDDILRKAIVPIAWLRECRSRLEYWQFLQELGGTNSYHTMRAVEKVRTELVADKEAEIEKLHVQLAAESEATRKEDLAKGISRMLQGLMDPDKMSKAPAELQEAFSVMTQNHSPKAEQTAEVQSTKTVVEPEKSEVQSDTVVSKEVWIETDMCTSCSDCTDALPSVFKYNDEKQAIVHNPTGGPYAKIVAAAEKCPARCIHPGLPHNPDEPGLDKLMKRAEKFN